MPSDTNDNESRDAERVDQAVSALLAGEVAAARTLLQKVIANTPSEYANSSEEPDGGLVVKFWDQQAFLHYVMWQKEQGQERSVRWVGNAYPRAHYYMGFLCVKTRQFQQALEYLERGHELEPTNPKFHFEKAQALVHAGDKQQALALYEAVTEVGPYVSALDLAVAWRGRGFVLIELGRLDAAEEALKSSLEIDPGNEVAMNELQYIEHLRQGGNKSPSEAVPTQAQSLSQCAICGKPVTQGVVVTVNGVPRTVCDGCQRKYTKKWWQFWK
jgi:tetratricopeptide (TPR) repeat protein